MHALTTWRCYVEMQQVKVLTHHCTLQHFRQQPHLSRRQARWMEYIEQYEPDLTIEYRPGRTNPAGPLSRRPMEFNAIGTVTWDPSFGRKFQRGNARDSFYTEKAPNDGRYYLDGPFWSRSATHVICVPDERRLRTIHFT